ncbi:MAG: ABC transporter permease [Planctomycetaceae bacterium]|nr:ABC transporter permease [Planctomycetaceae bacterium]MBT4011879.1 ABC transporter permease [Planctomycetaceae bacterium]MBT4846746.1 ABC transporter permease [Planctomycetaceae bacterium]MBT5123758.1 ABC transporter permease [Planctomycetaceae bacterium]MBT5600481.1 ABC transporter permease [Planctomycetaceae bacterium]
MKTKLSISVVLYPIIFLLLLLAVWQTADWIWKIPRILLPSPWEIITVCSKRIDDLWSATLITAQAAISGFALAMVIGTTLGLLFSVSKVARRGVYPYMIFLQTVPIVAIAPLIIIWFGGGMTSIVIIVTVISLFPIVTNVTTGLRTVDAGLLDLMTLYQATPYQVLFKVRLPNAIPYLVTGAKISSGLTIVGAVIGEYLAGHGIDEQGLGYYIFMGSQNFKTEVLFASIFLSSLLGVTMVTAVAVISRTLLARWTFQLER